MKLFLDANIIYSAAKSVSGASYALFQLKERLKVNLISSKLAVVEAERNIVEKEGSRVLERFYELIKNIEVIAVDNHKAKRFYKDIIEDKDAPILYGAKQSRAKFLITLDKKHFFTKKLLKEKLPFKITTPRDFFQLYC